VRGLAQRAFTEEEPADSPAIVIFEASPPKNSILL